MIAIYARQSIDKKDSLSIESQIEKCTTLCKMNDWNDYEVYKDPGWSGKDLKRPRFQDLIKDVSSGKITHVICYKLDRISRSMRDFVNVIADFEECGTKFISVTENIDTSSSAGRLLMTVIIAIAQMERENIIDRVTDNYYYRCNQGYWGGGIAPYGYKLKRVIENGKNHTILDINEDEAAVVRQFYEWYLEPSCSIKNILTKTIELGITTRNGSAWTSRVVSDLLWKPLYAPNNMDIYNYFKSLNANFVNPPEAFDNTASVNLYGKVSKQVSKHKRVRGVSELYFIVSKHQPIIDSTTWINVQKKKNLVLQTPARTGTGRASCFTGLIKCADCGRNISLTAGRNHVRYYVCSSLKNRGAGFCNFKTVRQDVFDTEIISDMLEHFSNEDVRRNVKNMANSNDKTNISNPKINSIYIEIAKIDDEIKNLIAAIATGNSTVTKYLNERIEELDKQKIKLNKQIHDYELKEYETNGRLNGLTIEDIDRILSTKEFGELKNLCNIVIKSITISPDKQICVEYYI